MAVWAILDRLLDLVGKTTLPDDWRQLMDERLPAWFGWLFSTPWWVPATLAVAAFAWMIWITVPRGKEQADADLLKQQRLMRKEQRLNRTDSDAFRQSEATRSGKTAISGDDREPQYFEARGLFVGQMSVAVDKLEQHGIITITAHCFNATNHPVALRNVSGVVSATAKDSGSFGKLEPPSVSSRWEVHDISYLSLFILGLEQQLSSELAERVHTMGDGDWVSLNFSDLKILFESKNDPKQVATLPIWDGVTIMRTMRRVHCGRVVRATGGTARFRISG